MAEDQAAQERGGAHPEPRRQVLAENYVHAVHPDHGEAVVYVPGQALPDWVVDAMDAGRFHRDRHGTVTLDAPRKGRSSS